MQNPTTAGAVDEPSDVSSGPDPAEYRSQVQSRTLRVLWVSSVFSRGAVSMVFAVAVLALKDLLGADTWAGLSTTSTTVGSALAAGMLAGYMQRNGRTSGLSIGLMTAVVGCVLCVIAIEGELLLVFLLGMVLIGVGSGTANLSRYAAADLAGPERRSRDISTVVFASTFGAVLFPLFVGPVNSLAADLGLNERSGGMAFGGISMVIGAVAIFAFMRPDPLVVAGGITDKATAKATAVPFRQAARVALAQPLPRLAFITLVVSQAVMVMVMAMTPLHMEAHGHGDGVVGQIISAHTLGMFAFAPLAGWMSDRFGRVPIIVLAGFTLAFATTLTALAGEAPKILMFPGLYLLGLGWSFGIVAGSALLTESVGEGDRVAVQGAADVAMNLASGIGALASGVVVDMAGFHVLSMVGIVAAAALMGQSWFERRLAVARV